MGVALAADGGRPWSGCRSDHTGRAAANAAAQESAAWLDLRGIGRCRQDTATQ